MKSDSQFSILNSQLVTVLALLLTLTGCTSLPKPDFSALKPAGQAQSVMVVWEPAVNNDGEKATRGFAGRLYFYDQDKTKPVKAHGSVIVYAFDEDGRNTENNKPDEGYIFDDKTLNSSRVYSKSKLGHSYNLWVPWDSEGPDGKAKKVSLIVRYIPKNGGTSVVSSQAAAYLPGKKMNPNQMIATVNNDSQIYQQVALRTPAELPGQMPEQKLRQAPDVKVIERNENRPQQMQSVTIR